MDLLDDFIGSIMLERIGAGFKWFLQFLIFPFSTKKRKSFQHILSGSKHKNRDSQVYLGFSNILAGFFVIIILIIVILYIK